MAVSLLDPTLSALDLTSQTIGHRDVAAQTQQLSITLHISDAGVHQIGHGLELSRNV